MQTEAEQAFNIMGGFLGFIIGLIVLIVFFAIAYRLGRIVQNTDILRMLELRKPENRQQVKCKNCNAEFSISVLDSKFRCPKCNTKNRLP